MVDAEQAIAVVTRLVKGVRARRAEGESNEELDAVIVTATARLVTNPGRRRPGRRPVHLELMVRQSQNSNTPVKVVAQQIVDSYVTAAE